MSVVKKRLMMSSFQECKMLHFVRLKLCFRSVIFDEQGLRSLQSLLQDYKTIIARYGFPTSGVKSSYIKDNLVIEFQDKILRLSFIHTLRKLVVHLYIEAANRYK